MGFQGKGIAEICLIPKLEIVKSNCKPFAVQPKLVIYDFGYTIYG